MSISKPEVVGAKKGYILRQGNGLSKLIKKVCSTSGVSLRLKALFSPCAWCEAFRSRGGQSGFSAHGVSASQTVSEAEVSAGQLDKLRGRKLLVSEDSFSAFFFTICLCFSRKRLSNILMLPPISTVPYVVVNPQP